MVFPLAHLLFLPLARLLFLSLSMTSTLARLPPRSDYGSETIRSLDATKDAGPHSAPSPPPCTAPRTGFILVSSNNANLNGYLAAQQSNQGTYDSVTNSTEDALQATFCRDEAAGNKTFNVYISVRALFAQRDVPDSRRSNR